MRLGGHETAAGCPQPVSFQSAGLIRVGRRWCLLPGKASTGCESRKLCRSLPQRQDVGILRQGQHAVPSSFDVLTAPSGSSPQSAAMEERRLLRGRHCRDAPWG